MSVLTSQKMLKYFLFLYLVHAAFGFKNVKNYFCNLHCGSEHTVCKRDLCVISKACGRHGEALFLNDEDREWVLDVHNRHRNKIAVGEDTAGGNSQAANMRALSYDKELEFVAQCWANACQETGKPHDECRETKKFSSVGQNMYGTSSSNYRDYRDKKYLTEAVESWYSEIHLTNAGDIDRYPGRRGIGHFTQVAWAETTHVGCGRVSYRAKDGFYSVSIYCNYGKSGNILGQPVYLRGQPCSKCRSHKCNKKYAGLCGKIEDLSEDRWLLPFS